MKEAEIAGHPISYKEAAESVHDLVRYTIASTPDTLVQNFQFFRENLEAKGYRYVKIKNTWENYSMNAPYRGVNTQIESPSGIVFELQFHTAESLVVKSVAHGMYEITRDPRVPIEEKAELLKQSYALFDRMRTPDRISEIVPPRSEQYCPGAPEGWQANDALNGIRYGSDIVMVFQDCVDVDYLCTTEGDGYTHILMGEPYANLKQKAN